MKCQKNKACVKQPVDALPDNRKKCTGCDKPSKSKNKNNKGNNNKHNYCNWKLNVIDDFYETGCKNVFVIVSMIQDEEFKDEEFKFCPYCGKLIQEVKK